MQVNYSELFDSKVEQLLQRVQGGELTPSEARFELTIYSEAIKDVIFKEFVPGHTLLHERMIKNNFVIFDEAVRLIVDIPTLEAKLCMSMAKRRWHQR